MPRLSVVVSAFNQQARLRLVLRGLQNQTLDAAAFEIIVVDDGSSDATAAMAQGLGLKNLRVLRLKINQGACIARNAGFAEAVGDIVLFLDGDALPSPRLLESHLLAHEGGPSFVCASRYSLGCTEFLEDPATASLLKMPLHPQMVSHISSRPEQFTITEADVQSRPASIAARAERGCYPGGSSRRSEEQVEGLFLRYEDPLIGWVGFSAHNGSAPRQALLDCGGFDCRLRWYEGWELAYRLRLAGLRARLCSEARSYHLHHFRDNLSPAKIAERLQARVRSAALFADKHDEPVLDALMAWRQSSQGDPWIPHGVRFESLRRIEEAVRAGDSRRLDACRRILDGHPMLGPLRRQWRCGSADSRSEVVSWTH